MDERRRVWFARIHECADLAELDRIEGELQAVYESWAGPLRFKLAERRVKLRNAVGPNPGKDYGLPVPDARRLYAYRLGDAIFSRIEADLARAGSLASLQSGLKPGLFVLWASEWFRRCYKGGGLIWAELMAPLGLQAATQADQNVLRDIARRGLQQWRRPIIRLSHGREFLSTLAREGGFPTAAVKDGGSGWARQVLEAIVKRLLGEAAAGAERAIELAQAQRARLPATFQDDDFVQLCADLAMAIVTIRREAEPQAAAQGIPISAWLALHRPEWREALPLTTGEGTADALIEGLMTVEAVTGAAVGAVRLLARDTSGWFEAVRIGLDGDVDGPTMQRLDPAEGRLRAFACGDLARHLPGELGMFEPPALGETQWTARSTRLARDICRVPFAATLELELRAGERRIDRITIAQGKPRRGQLLVAELDEGDSERPRLLRVVGAGSGKYRAETVFVQVPTVWKVTPTVDETADLLGPGVGETQIWRITGGTFVTDEAGDRHRIRCGQPTDRNQRIDLVGNHCGWADVSGDIDVFCGPPHARPGGPEGALVIRELGSRQWRKAPSVLPVGYYELGWRDENILLDRRRIAVLPQAALLQRSGVGKDVRYELQGFGAVALVPAADAPVRATSDGMAWTGAPGAAAQARFGAHLAFPDGQRLAVSIDFPCAAGIAHWDGTIVRETITLDRIRDFVAMAEGPMELVAELHEPRQRRCAELSWHFDRELPLASIAQDLASLLMPATIDAWVTLGMHDGIGTQWRLDPFPFRLGKESGGLVANRAVVLEGAELCGRSLADPCFEASFGVYSLLSDANHRPVHLSSDAKGDWLVYLRAGETILSRPIVAPPCYGDPVATTALGRAMAVPYVQLDGSLHAFLTQAAEPGAKAHVQELTMLAVALGGLPPATLRVFELLPQYPQVLARMACHAAPEQREAILALADALPFSWCVVPRSCWDIARGEVFDSTFSLVATLPNPAAIAMQSIRLTENALIGRVPLLGPILRPADAQPLEEIANSFLNRAFDRVHGSSRGRYRRHLGTALPAFFERYDDGVLDTLDAPCAAALAAAGKWVPGSDDIRHIETVARTCPRYFAEAFAAWLKEHS